MAAPTKPSKPAPRPAATAADPTVTRTPRRRPILVDLYRSSIGKKWAMAVSGVIMMGYVLVHMLANLKLYQDDVALNDYATFLKGFGTPALPDQGFLWIARVVLLAAFLIHIHAAYGLTRMNRAARPAAYANKRRNYEQSRDYVAADFASRTMRWTGIIVGLFIVYHVLHLTTGTVHSDFEHGEVFDNVVTGFENPLVSAFYIVANLALGLHLYHGSYSIFRTFGASNPRFEQARRGFAIAFAAVVVVGNVSFPIAVLTGIVP